jgi:orotate phosphoribosyltransferase-like protein
MQDLKRRAGEGVSAADQNPLQKRLKKARALLRSGDYTKGQVADELKVARHTLWRALSREAAKGGYLRVRFGTDSAMTRWMSL